MKNVMITLMVVMVLTSTSLAVMGPPVAGLEEGQLSVGFDYSVLDVEDIAGKQSQSYQEQILCRDVFIEEMRTWYVDRHFPWLHLTKVDIYGDKIHDYYETSSGKYKKHGPSNKMAFARVGYGITDDIELFTRHGGAEVDPGGELDTSTAYAFGFGAKITLFKKDALSIGVVGQWHQYDWEEDIDGEVLSDESWDSLVLTGGKYSLEYSEWKFLVGPALEVTDWCTVYGGPYYSILDGSYETEQGIHGEFHPDSGGSCILDGTEKSKSKFSTEEFGGAIGAQFNVSSQISVNLEAQLTSDTNLLGASAVYRF